MSLLQQQLGGLGGLANCGQLGSAFSGGAAQAMQARSAALNQQLRFDPAPQAPKEKSLREELQAETDEWLKEAVK